jgi:predicted nucleic acid-binding protein
VILVDSSIWIAVEHRRIQLADHVSEDEFVATCPTVMLEVLRGTRDEARYAAARKFLLDAEMLDSPTPRVRFEEAARIYLKCRSVGITPDVPDCLVAACAIWHDVPILHQDSDFDMMARVIPALKIFSRSSS